MITNAKLLLRNAGYPQMEFINNNEDLQIFDKLERKNITEEQFKKIKEELKKSYQKKV